MFEILPAKPTQQARWTEDGATEYFIEAITKNNLSLQDVPQEIANELIYEIAVTVDGMNLQFVPDEFRTQKICEEAVAENGKSLQFVPEKLKDQELCIMAVKNNELAIEFVATEDQEMVKANARAPKRSY